MTKLFVVVNLEKFENMSTKKLINKMPPKRIKKFTALPKHKKFECLAGFLLAVYCIKQNFKTKKTLKFSKKSNGKPLIDNHKNIFFNISHTKNAIACAISTNEIGVDIEKIHPIDFDLAKRICCNNELKVFETLTHEKNNFLLKIWTAKESFVKMKSKGIFSNIKKIDAMKIKNLKTFCLNENVLSVCGLRPIGFVEPIIVDFKTVIEYSLKHY